MTYTCIYEKEFVERILRERRERNKRELIDVTMCHVWDGWVSGTVLEFQHELLDPIRDSTINEFVAESAEKGWVVKCERIGNSQQKLKISIS